MNPHMSASEGSVAHLSSEGEGSTAQKCSETSGSSGKRKDYIKRSVVWNHFTEFVDGDKKKCKCNYCAKEYNLSARACGTSNLLNHMRVCPSYPGNQKDQSILTYQTNNTDGKPGVESKISLLSWKFDQQAARKAIAEMIIIDELPFKFVENAGFKRCMRVCQPSLLLPSRSTITRDCYQLFIDERSKVKAQIKNNSNRICLTTDTWTSVQRINYMCLTAHFIDTDWKLQKKVLNFCPVSSHRGQDIGKAIEMCLVDWSLQNVFTITVDNASSNDVAIEYLRRKFVNWGQKCVLQGKWTHIRCVAHILNLIVQDGLKDLGGSIESVRAAIRYVRQSPARIKRFMGFADIEKCDCSKSLCLDVPTRWNSTYLMLSVAEKYERVFDRLDMEDTCFRDDLENHGSKPGVPTYWDWGNVRVLVIFLRHFYRLTLKVSGTKYITSNTFLDDISCIHGVLKEYISCEDEKLRNMASQMKKKFDKYWGCPEKFNLLVFIACVLDPRNKFEYVDIIISNMYGTEEGGRLSEKVKSAIYELFNEYKRLHCTPIGGSSSCSIDIGSIPVDLSLCNNDSEPMNKLKEKYRAELKRRKADSGSKNLKSELDRYLTEEDDEDEDYDNENFSVLDWWRARSPRFPILSLIARDVLAIPISTVASESVFSTGGRVLDSFRSSLTPKIVQALICSQDWLRSDASQVEVEERNEDLEKFEQEIKQSVPDSTVVDV